MSHKIKNRATSSSDESEVETTTSRYPDNDLNNVNKMFDQTTSSDESKEEKMSTFRAAKERFNKAQKNVQNINETLLRLQVEMNHTEVQWLQLCSIVQSQQSNSPEEEKIDPQFKAAEDINTTCLDLTIVPKEYNDSYNSDLE